jgi:hypothetical protein
MFRIKSSLLNDQPINLNKESYKSMVLTNYFLDVTLFKKQLILLSKTLSLFFLISKEFLNELFNGNLQDLVLVK